MNWGLRDRLSLAGCNQISINIVMPIAEESRDCTPLEPVLSSLGIAKLQQTFATGFKVGALEVDHFMNDTGVGFHDVAQINFFKLSNSPLSPLFAARAFESKPLGARIAAPQSGGGDNGSSWNRYGRAGSDWVLYRS